MKYNYYSYDVFDTVLIRSCGSPENVFDILAHKVLGDADLSSRIDFACERKEGENRARKKYIDNNSEEVTLDQIYSCSNFKEWTDLSNKKISEIEIDIEKQVLTPVLSVKKEITEKRNEGAKIIFISDMYLPSTVIAEILKENNILDDKDSLYVSSDYKKTKRTGSLYNYIFTKEHIDKKKWIHNGDNQFSDIVLPQQMGINVKKVQHCNTYYENITYNKDYSGDIYETQILASISKSIVHKYGNDSKVLFASDFIAPLFVPFVFWLMTEASKKGIKKLFFLARDGYILYQIAQMINSHFKDIELIYLYASRKALYLPGLEELDADSISKFFWSANHCTKEELCDRLLIKNHDLYNCPDNLIGPELINYLFQDPIFINEIKRNRDEQRNLALRYFSQEGLGEQKCAIVDLTGTRKCQRSINTILKAGNKETAFAYYFKVLSNRDTSKDYEAMFYDDKTMRNSRNCSICPHDLFEQYFSITNLPRTSCYKEDDLGNVIPVFESESNNSSFNNKSFKINSLIVKDFTNQYKLSLSNANHKLLCQTSMSTYSLFYHLPQKQYLEAFRNIVFYESQNISRPLFSKNFHDAFNRLSHEWVSANIMINCKFPKLLFKIMEYEYNKCSDSNTQYLFTFRYHRLVSKIKRKIKFIFFHGLDNNTNLQR